MTEPKGRPVGGTEYSLCRAVPGGSGITVVALLLSHPAPSPSILQNTLQKIQNSHPILRSKLTQTHTPSLSFSISPSQSLIQIQTFDLSTTSNLLQTLSPSNPLLQISPFHLLLEHEFKQNPWSETQNQSQFDVFFATLYSLPDSKWVFAIRLHPSVCDRTSAVVLSRELLGLMGEWEEEGAKWVFGNEGGDEIGLPIEELVPKGKGDKPFWGRGVDLVGYSLNSLRISNLGFDDVCSNRCTEVVRFQLSKDETDRLLSECREREIKLFGALAAAALIAANSSKHLPNNQSENYAVLILVDCRKTLDPAPHDHHLGFYHSGILNTHSITKGEGLWDVAKRCYAAFSNAMKCNKHLRDMGDLNYLMCRAIENPGLTPSSSLRTSYIAVFEDPVIDEYFQLQQKVGLEDYIGCASVHGFGPSIAVSDSIRDGRLDCSCVYPSPLHSRKRMQGLIDDMEKILVGEGD